MPDVLIGDPGRLRQIILNLVGNSIKFTSKGEVAIDIRIKAQRAQQCELEFDVRDTGVGIALEKQKRSSRPSPRQTHQQLAGLEELAWDYLSRNNLSN